VLAPRGLFLFPQDVSDVFNMLFSRRDGGGTLKAIIRDCHEVIEYKTFSS
jgi:hypothetical protein